MDNIYSDAVKFSKLKHKATPEWFAEQVCEARNIWSQRHELAWLEDCGPHPDDFIGQYLAEALRKLANE